MKIQITTEYLESLKPCEDRLKNWLEHYGNWSGSLNEFLDLDKITHQDKIWVFFRSIPKEKIAPIAGEFAEQVLHIYAKYNPDTSVLIEAIRCAKENDVNAAASAAYAAAYAAADAADAADAAYAAARAAYAAAYAAYAAAYAARAAYAAAYAARAAYAAADSSQADIQLQIMKKWAMGGGE